jgi:hypothetical protein
LAAKDKEQELKEMSGVHRRSIAMRTISLARNHRVSKNVRTKLRCFCSWRRLSLQNNREEERKRTKDLLISLETSLETMKQEVEQNEKGKRVQRLIVMNLAQNRASLQHHHWVMETRRQVLLAWLQSVKKDKIILLKKSLDDFQTEKIIFRKKHAIELKRMTQAKEIADKSMRQQADEVLREHNRTLAMRTIKMARNARINKNYKIVRKYFYEWKLCRFDLKNQNLQIKLIEIMEKDEKARLVAEERKATLLEMKSKLETTHDQLSKFQERQVVHISDFGRLLFLFICDDTNN